METPNGLRTAGAKLWKEMNDEFDFSYEPGKVAILERACKVADQIDKLEQATAEEPMTTRGSMGQLVIHPFIQEIRQQSNVFNSLIKALDLPDSDEDAAIKADRRRERAVNANSARWNRGGSK